MILLGGAFQIPANLLSEPAKDKKDSGQKKEESDKDETDLKEIVPEPPQQKLEEASPSIP